MTLSKVNRALGVMRAYLVERATEPDRADDRFEDLARTVVDSVLQPTKVTHREPAAANRLGRDSLRRAIRFIRENLDSKLKCDDIAAAIGVDLFTFSRSFKSETGMTPHQYIIHCRIRRAMQLLASRELTLAEVALEVGCSCQSHLTTLFRKHLGTTPGAYRGAPLRATGARQ
ncbi:MAG TPA: AraC family transcriptional regulator [Gammaproteobacteria bacterium]|nr:AraC family transcriptional regulator [Gammaproteobacteria bacterium]